VFMPVGILLTPAQVASKLKVTNRTVSEWLKRGELRGLKLGRLWRVPEEDLEEFLSRNRQSPQSSSEAGVRSFTRKQINAFIEADKLDEETALKVERLLGR